MKTRFATWRGWIGKLPEWLASFLAVCLIDRMLTPLIPFFPARLLADAVLLMAAAIVLGVLIALVSHVRRAFFGPTPTDDEFH